MTAHRAQRNVAKLGEMIIYCMGDTGGPGPKIFVLQSDEGARENTVRGPGTPVSPIQYTIL